VKLSEAWSISKVSYAELVYRPILRSGFAIKDAGTKKSVSRALTGAAINKVIFAVFTLGGAVFPFVVYRLGLEAISLTVAVALSIVLVFGYVVLYSVQVVPSFVSSGSLGPLALLPLTPTETSTVALMTLWRTLDYVLVLSLVAESFAVAYFTASALAVILVLATSLSSSLLAIAMALWLTAIFQSRLEGREVNGRAGGLASLRGLVRPLLFIVWGLGVMSAVFLFSLVSFVAPPLNAVLNHPSEPLGVVASLLFPFSAGLLVSHFSGYEVGHLSLVLASTGVALVVAGSAYISLKVPGIINNVVVNPARGAETAHAGGMGDFYSFRLRGRLSAYVLKDLRVASRNPATGFLFALPIFEILAVVVPLTAASVVRMSALLVGAQVGGGFALFTAFLLVTVEDLGVERRTALPFSELVRTLSKVVVSTLTYLPVPFAMAVVLLLKPSTFSGGIFIPFAALASVFAGCVMEVTVLNRLNEWGRGTAVRFVAGVGSGELILLLPSVAYAVEYILSQDRLTALVILVVISGVEVLASLLLLRISRDKMPASTRDSLTGVLEGDVS
jgi:predicted permease